MKPLFYIFLTCWLLVALVGCNESSKPSVPEGAGNDTVAALKKLSPQDSLEALMGAVWLDGGLPAARAVFAVLDLPFKESFNEWDANPKGYLQVKAQAMHPPRRPVYEVTQMGGVAHAPIVTVRVSVHGLGEAVATAGSKSAAEVAAAAALLEKVSFSDPA